MLILTNDTLITFQKAPTVSGGTTITATVSLAEVQGSFPGFDSVCFLTEIGTTNAGNYLKAGEGLLANGTDASDLLNSEVVPTGSGPIGVAVDVVKPNKPCVTLSIIRGGANTTIGDIWAIFYNSHGGPISSVGSNPLPVVVSTNVAQIEGTA